MTEAEYQTQKAGLEAQMVALEAAWASSREYPKWVYHETEPAQIVNSEAEAEALGAGWSSSPGGPAVAPPTGGATAQAAEPPPARYGPRAEEDRPPAPPKRSGRA